MRRTLMWLNLDDCVFQIGLNFENLKDKVYYYVLVSTFSKLMLLWKSLGSNWNPLMSSVSYKNILSVHLLMVAIPRNVCPSVSTYDALPKLKVQWPCNEQESKHPWFSVHSQNFSLHKKRTISYQFIFTEISSMSHHLVVGEFELF